MKVGDLVQTMNAHDLKVRLGIIVKQLPKMEIGLDVFEVLRSDGTIQTYTSAALRPGT